MSQISIRTLKLEEAAPILSWALGYAFTPSPPVHKPEELLERFKPAGEHNKYMAVFDGETAVATAGAGQMTQNVRGALVDSAGIFMVTTHPAHRRKGYSFQLLKELFKQSRDEGHGVSTLYPFRESFYERLGYINLPAPLIAEINHRALAPLIGSPNEATLELTEFIERPEDYFDFLKQCQQHIHGMALFKQPLPPDPERHKYWLLTAEIDGKPDGIMLYTMGGDGPGQLKLEASRFYTLSPASRYAFLGWIGRHVDQANQISITLPPFEQPHTWFSDLEIKLSARKMAPMGRVLDVEKLNGLPAGDGRFTAEIIDPVCPWNQGAWSFTGQNGKLKVEKASGASFTLGIQGLSALVFGTLPPEAFTYRQWGQVPAEVGRSMSAVFPPATPHLHEYF